MFHRMSTWRSYRRFTLPLHLLLVSLLAAGGCMSPQTRLQSEDDERDKEAKYDVKVIGDVTSMANTEPMIVGGVALVVGLEGTGSEPIPGGHRTMLENDLKKELSQHRGEGAPTVRELLASPNVSMVVVSAKIPAGARKGDPIDVEVTLPPGSRTTSLKGGYLRKCNLYNYDTAKNLVPNSPHGDKSFVGHPIAVAEGHLLVGFGDGDEATRLRNGKIWSGGKTRIDRPFYLVMNSDKQYASVASAVADRINQTFHGSLPRTVGQELAVAKTNTHVVLNVPPQYRLNLPRYLRVVRMIPLREPSATAMAADRASYRQRLAEDLLDPNRCVIAALRLEAVGHDMIPVLKEGLQSEHALVRFCAAESLAYQRQPAAGEVLASMVEHQPALRAFSLTALASLDEAVSHIKLRELLASRDAETRYGAFRALRALDEHDEAVQGELLNESFWLHKVADRSQPLVHLASNRRAEIVLFGEVAQLKPPFSFLAGEFTVTAGDNDDRCTISRFAVGRPPSRKQCTLKLEDVIRTLAHQGGTYSETVELLRQVESCDQLTCRVMVDALPQAISVYELARAGGELKKSLRTGGGVDEQELIKRDEEIVRARVDLGVTPNLFERDPVRRPRSVQEREQETAQQDLRRPANPGNPGPR